MIEFRLGTHVRLGVEALTALDQFADLRSLVVTDRFLSTTDVFAEVVDRLGDPTVYSEVIPNPTIEAVGHAVTAYLMARPQVVVAYGGGSVIDTAKAMHKAALDAGMGAEEGLVAIPTTSGSGSEVTSYAVITDEKSHAKIPIVSPDLVARLAILDPKAVQSVPPKITADSGMDVLTHAVEAYVARLACDFSDAFAEKAVQLVFANLVRCFTNGDDMDARSHMHNASCMAAMAFDNVGLGITHSLAHALGGRYPIAHGRLNAILLPHVIRYNAEHSEPAAERYGRLGALISPAAHGRAGVQALVGGIERLNQKLAIPARIREEGVDPSDANASLDGLAHSALDDGITASNPVPPSLDDLKAILRQVI
ncbi:MAG: 1-propanol dehydrogenase PduQ [Acidobacteriota bacterium]|nr:1-propanol dehydrogenase PduQ [Acidobacteriota bacterium]